MDSINKNQPEDNFKDLSGKGAVDKVKEIVDQAKTCFFITGFKSKGPVQTRPMSVQKIDSEGNLWFLSANDSHKNVEIEKDPHVQLMFQGSPHSDFLNLFGRATISTDKKKIKELWEPIVKAWFTEGIDDPRITIIKVEPSDGYYWDNKHGNAIAYIKMLAGVAMGKTLDDSVNGTLRV
jgi:general stress protein 26